LSNTTMRV